MQTDIQRSVFRVLDHTGEDPNGSPEAGKTVGAAFLICDRLAVTCAHVVDAAHGKAGADLWIEGYCTGTRYLANVLDSGYSPVDEADIAFLALEQPPEGMQVARLSRSPARSVTHGAIIFGFPGGEGAPLPATITGLLASKKERYPLRVYGGQGRSGISGAPVFDTRDKKVVGMVAWGYQGPGAAEIRAVSAAAILGHIPDRRRYGCADKKRWPPVIAALVVVLIALGAAFFLRDTSRPCCMTGWSTYIDPTLAATAAVSIQLDELADGLQVAYAVPRGGWFVILFQDFDPGYFSGKRGFRFDYDASQAQADLFEIKAFYAPGSGKDGQSRVFGSKWTIQKPGVRRIEVRFADLRCFESLGCAKDETVDPAKVRKIDIAILNPTGEDHSGQITILDFKLVK